MAKVVKRNSTIPVLQEKEFTTCEPLLLCGAVWCCAALLASRMCKCVRLKSAASQCAAHAGMGSHSLGKIEVF